MTFAQAVAEIQALVDAGRPVEEVCAAIARHADEGAILVDDVVFEIDGKPVTSFTLELGGDA